MLTQGTASLNGSWRVHDRHEGLVDTPRIVLRLFRRRPSRFHSRWAATYAYGLTGMAIADDSPYSISKATVLEHSQNCEMFESLADYICVFSEE